MAAQETFVTNSAESTLSSSVAVGATTLNVASTAAFPAVPFYATIDPGVDASREVVLATAKTATTLTVTRAQDGTSDVAHASGAVIAVVPVAALWTDINDRVDGKEDAGTAATAVATHEAGADPHPGYLTSAEGNAAYAPLTHAARHANGGADEITVEGLGTAATDTSLALKPDGAGGVAFGAVASASSFVGAKATRSAQAVASGGWAVISLTAEDYDTDAFHDNTTNPSRMTVPTGKAGKYRISGVGLFAANSTGQRYLNLAKNGTRLAINDRRNAVSGDSTSVVMVDVLDLIAGDYVEAHVFQNSGSSLNLDAYLIVEYLGA